MNNKKLIIILFIVTGVILVATITSFMIIFYDQNISKDIANWGQFGDYIGGILNPLLSVVNLIILAVLSIRLVKIEDERNKWTIKELARPYLGLSFTNQGDNISINMMNCGMGPLILKKVCIKDDKNNEYVNFKEIIEPYTKNQKFEVYLNFFILTNSHGLLAKDKEIHLMKLSTDLSKKDAEIKFKNLKKEINKYTIEIDYTDIYGTEMEKVIDRIEFAIV